MMRILIRNGHIIDPANRIDAVGDIAVADGRIIACGEAPAGFNADRIIDADNLIVCPGLVDLYAHLREPGDEHKATIASETRAAAHGGITTLCCPPDTDPVIDTPAVASLIFDQAEAAGSATVLPLGALTRQLAGEQLSPMYALKEVGCIGLSQAMRAIDNNLILLRAMEYAATHDLTIHLRAENGSLADNGCVHNGAVGMRLGLPGIPEAAETVAVATALALVEETGVRIHFSMLSTARAVRMIARARYDGLPVTASVSAHHLHLTELDILDFDSRCHVRPPLRSQRDREGLRHGLRDGTITAICSDHQPHESDAKLAPFSDTAVGISALETLLPLALQAGHEIGLTRVDTLALLTTGPATVLGIDAGTLSPDTAADICIFDPEQYWLADETSLLSRGHNTPFLNWEMKGRVHYTLHRGRCVYDSED
jgi:dihydroorotase